MIHRKEPLLSLGLIIIPPGGSVIPYGKIVLVMTQTVNFFKGEVKDKLSYKIEEVDEKLEVINNCKS